MDFLRALQAIHHMRSMHHLRGPRGGFYSGFLGWFEYCACCRLRAWLVMRQ